MYVFVGSRFSEPCNQQTDSNLLARSGLYLDRLVVEISSLFLPPSLPSSLIRIRPFRSVHTHVVGSQQSPTISIYSSVVAEKAAAAATAAKLTASKANEPTAAAAAAAAAASHCHAQPSRNSRDRPTTNDGGGSPAPALCCQVGPLQWMATSLIDSKVNTRQHIAGVSDMRLHVHYM